MSTVLLVDASIAKLGDKTRLIAENEALRVSLRARYDLNRAAGESCILRGAGRVGDPEPEY